MATSLTDLAASWVDSGRLSAAPESVVERVKAAIIDTVGVALAGAGAAPSEIVGSYIRQQGGSGFSTVLLQQRQVPPAAAVFANATFAHALDYDDTTYGANGHLSSILAPVALALAEHVDGSGRLVIHSYLAGFEVGSRLGRDMNPLHYESGWHSTATIGTIAAAAAASRAMSLSAAQTKSALGIAASSAGGLRANIGSMVKPLHSGLAARDGVEAAELAALGLVAASDGLGGRYGFSDMFAPGRDVGPALGERDAWDLETIGVAQKRYPCCAASHRALDGLLGLRARHELLPTEVDRIECGVDYMVPTYMVYPDPQTPEEARFSMEHTLAVAMIDGAASFEQFGLPRLRDTAVRDLANRVQMYVHPELAGADSWRTRFADVAVTMRSGQVHRARVYEQRGHPNNPLSTEELTFKFMEAASLGVGRERASRILHDLERLEEIESVRPLIEGFGGG